MGENSIFFLLYLNEFVGARFGHAFCPHFRHNLAGNGEPLAPVCRFLETSAQCCHRENLTYRVMGVPPGIWPGAPLGKWRKKLIISTSGPSSTL
jgi:hypothetical protein